MNLHHHIAGTFLNGLSYDDAVQLCLRLYSSVDRIPDELHSQCTKDNLALVFSHLVAEGVVVGEPITAAIYGANFHAPNDKGHWIEVIASIFKMANTIDKERGERLASRLAISPAE